MERLIPKIKEIAERISRSEEKRKKLADFLKEVGDQAQLLKSLEPSSLDKIKIAAVDGGVVKKSLHGFDCILVRAVGVCFSYKKGKVEKVEYFPGRVPTPVPDMVEALSDLEWSHFSSVMRLRVEVNTAIRSMERFAPDLLLMDGSIVPHYQDRPARGSTVYENYISLLEDYKRFFSKADKSKATVAGVIEDSRGRSFSELVAKGIVSQIKHSSVPELVSLLERTRDTNLLYWVLEKGERSRTFPYSEKPGEHPVLRDLGEYAPRIQSFYLKTARWDRPVRVDYLGEQDKADWISSNLLAISGHHSGYGLPAPLIEADNVAKLSETEIDNFYSHILNFAGNIPSVMRLRREQRPF